MDTLLAVIAFLGLGALLISAFVFASAARRYVSGDAAPPQVPGHEAATAPDRGRQTPWNRRSIYDRRRNSEPVRFPIIVDGQLIAADRRRGERRRNRTV
ncbi:MAG: hypothetical protein V2I82_00355 [Halieaceae bacterium]|nr:hypothetical protein [Halieaceae bacterium]